MRITTNFSEHEFACPCCGIANIDHDFVRALQQIRDGIHAPMVIKSGCRCPGHNEAVGGAPNSAHITTPIRQGHAADILCTGNFSRYQLVALAIAAGIRRIGVYRDKSIVHLDNATCLPTPRLWVR